MAERGSRSKKPSAASSQSKQPPSDPAFFIDRSLGRHTIANALRAAGCVVEVHDDHFPADARDVDWLRVAGQKRWVVLTKDDRIRYHLLEKEALVAADVAAFILPRGDLEAEEMAAIFVASLGRIRKILLNQRRPFIARITRTGDVSVIYPEASRR